jgi:polyhydroxyalkanoate synthesis regulator phasin
VIQHILRYLIEYPEAKDTTNGILRWWFPRGSVDRAEEEVQEVLDTLVARGWLTQRQTITSQTLYGMNKEKLEEIKLFLRELERETEEEGGR